MATDPITGITIEEFETGFSTDLGATLREFAHLPPSLNVPYLTAYLDWRPDGERPATRTARTILEREFHAIRNQYEGNHQVVESLDKDNERIRHFLNEDLDPSVHGVMIISSALNNVFETIVLALPMPTRITAGPTPDLLPMTRVVEDFPRYAVLVADQHEARILIINRASRLQSTFIEAEETPRKHKKGGWSQRRFQARYHERVAHYARAVAEETRKALDDENIDMLVVAGGEVITSALNHAFHPSVKERIVSTIPMDIRTTTHEVITATTPLVTANERKKEAAALQALSDAVGTGDRGATGPAETLDALQAGTVQQLIMSADFHEVGWADYEMNVYGVGQAPSTHPAGGDPNNIVPVDLEEEMVRLTVITGAEGEIIPTELAQPLQEYEGIGAILRY